MFFFVSCVPPQKTSQQKGIRRTNRTAKNPRGFVFFEKDDVKKSREQLRDLFMPHRPVAAIDGPISLSLAFLFPYMKSTRKGIIRSGEWQWHVSKPDWDNASKGVADILEDCAFYTHDAHITLAFVMKAHVPPESAGIAVAIKPMPPPDESPVLRAMRDRIDKFHREHPADHGACPRCWRVFGRAIPMPLAGLPCHLCGRISDREPAAPAAAPEVTCDFDLIDPNELFEG